MEKRAYLFIVLAAALWGTVGVFGRELGNMGFKPLQISSIRAVCAVLSVVVILLFKNRRAFKIELRDSIYFVGTGILSFAFFNWCYFIAINKTSLSVAAILLYTAPAFVMVFSAILFKERMTGRKLLSLVLTIIGCVFVTLFVKNTEQRISAIGVLAGLGSGLGYALYSIFGRYALKKYDSITVTLYTFVFASLGLIPISNLSETINLFYNPKAIYFSLALGICATVMPFLFYTKGLSYIESSKASIIATLEPVVATVIGILLFKETITIFKITGILLIILAIYILAEKSKIKQS